MARRSDLHQAAQGRWFTHLVSEVENKHFGFRIGWHYTYPLRYLGRESVERVRLSCQSLAEPDQRSYCSTNRTGKFCISQIDQCIRKT